LEIKSLVLAAGTDIVHVTRFARMTPQFIQRVFTPSERVYLCLEKLFCENESLRENKNLHADEVSTPHEFSPRVQQSAAGIFAAKEAVAKALGTGFRGFFPNEIEITHDSLGKPRVILHNNAAKIARKIFRKRFRIHISISHTDMDALAFAVISRR